MLTDSVRLEVDSFEYLRLNIQRSRRNINRAPYQPCSRTLSLPTVMTWHLTNDEVQSSSASVVWMPNLVVAYVSTPRSERFSRCWILQIFWASLFDELKNGALLCRCRALSTQRRFKQFDQLGLQKEVSYHNHLAGGANAAGDNLTREFQHNMLILRYNWIRIYGMRLDI